MKKIISSVVLGIGLITSSSVQAEQQNNKQFYVGARGFYSQANHNIKTKNEEGYTRLKNGSKRYNDWKSWGAELAVGTYLTPALRTEFSFSRRKDDTIRGDDTENVETVDFKYSDKQSLEQKLYMVNFYYDFDLGMKFKPYVMAGVGIGQIKYKYKESGVITTFGSAVGSFSGNYSSDHSQFAWNIGVGTGIDLTDNLILDVGYRYVNNGTLKANAKGSTTYNVLGTSSVDNEPLKSKIKLDSHEFLVGLRYSF